MLCVTTIIPWSIIANISVVIGHLIAIFDKEDKLIDKYGPAILLPVVGEVALHIIIELEHHLPRIGVDALPLIRRNLVEVLHERVVQVEVILEVEGPQLDSHVERERLGAFALQVEDVDVQLAEVVPVAELFPEVRQVLLQLG